MHLYELIKMYGEGQGKDAMWKSVKHISDFVEKAKAALPEEYALLKKQVYADMQGGHYNEEFAMEQVQKMYYKDKSGIKHFAPYWTNDVIQKAYAEAKERIPECYNVWDFLVALNMVKADNKRLMDKWFHFLMFLKMFLMTLCSFSMRMHRILRLRYGRTLTETFF